MVIFYIYIVRLSSCLMLAISVLVLRRLTFIMVLSKQVYINVNCCVIAAYQFFFNSFRAFDYMCGTRRAPRATDVATDG